MTETLTKPDIFLACDTVRSAAKPMVRRRHYRKVARHVFHAWQSIKSKSAAPLLLVSTLDNVDSRFATQARSLGNRKKAYLLICERSLCKAIPERMAKLRVGDPERIHIAHADDRKGLQEILQRLFSTLSREDQAERIFDAWWEGDTLVVLSPRFKRLHVPLAQLRPLKDQPPESLKQFEIDEEGAYVYWPSLDVHLGWEQFAQAADEKEYLKARQQSEEFNRRYGAAIRNLRKQARLRQKDIKGLTARQVGRIERGRCRATHAALAKLAKAHKTSLSDYMASIAELVG